MSKIVPNKLSPLTYYLLEHYNDRLKCEVCHQTWTPDGTAFSKDQAGTKNGMYYRYFRCKGKSKGKCSASYSHEDFLTLATRQLGQIIIDEVKNKINSNPSSVQEPTTSKRAIETISTGFTPQSKRHHSSSLSISSPPPKFAFSHNKIPDSREQTSDSMTVAQLTFQVERTESMNDILKQTIQQKDEYITILKEKIDFLIQQRESHICISTVLKSPSPHSRVQSLKSPSIQDEDDLKVPRVSISPSPQVQGTSGHFLTLII